MYGGRLAADAVDQAPVPNDSRQLATARRRFMKAHGRIFWVLGLLQYFWYRNDKRREQFVTMCKDPDVQRLTWESYMNKKLVRKDPLAHVRVFFKDVAQLLGLASPR
jgi:geranylgeranyl diphosphate/geranylgeranyl-bacteriochlorophyllide a reductase